MGNSNSGFGEQSQIERFWLGQTVAESKLLPNDWNELLQWATETTTSFQKFVDARDARVNTNGSNRSQRMSQRRRFRFVPYVLCDKKEYSSLESLNYMERAQFLAKNAVVAVMVESQSPSILTVGNFISLHFLLQNYLHLLSLLESRRPTRRQDYCAICWENKSDIIVLSCEHSLCTKCYERWVPRKLNCPYCRRQFKKATLKDNQWETLDYHVRDVRSDVHRVEIHLRKVMKAIVVASASSNNLLKGYEARGRNINSYPQTPEVIAMA